MKTLKWLLNSIASTTIGNAFLAAVLIGTLGAASAALETSWDVTNNPQMFLNASISGTQTGSIKLDPISRNGTTYPFPTTTGGILRIRQGSKVEDISYTSATVNSSNITTLDGVTRDICWNQAYTLVSCGNGQSFGKGAIVELTQDARLFNFKANKDRANTFSASGAIQFIGSGSFSPPQFATTAERDAQMGATGSEVRMACVSATNLCYLRLGGSWTAIGDTGTANATEATAGKIELSTPTDHKLASETGDAGPLVAQVKYLTATGGTTSQAWYVPILDSVGLLDSSMIPASAGDSVVFGDGSDGDVTLTGTTTLTRDMFYDDLVLSGATLNTGGWRVFARTISGSGTIAAPAGRNGLNGTNATSGTTSNGGTGGAGGTASMSGTTLPATGTGSTGGNGGGANVGNITENAVPGDVANVSLYSLSGTTGTGGVAGGAGGTANAVLGGTSSGGAGGTATLLSRKTITDYIEFAFRSATTIYQMSGAGTTGYAGGGGGGAYGTSPACTNGASEYPGGGGGGGGAGSNGGYWLVAVRTISGTITIKSLGGNGGNGGNGSNASTSGSGNCGGGGGGAGGSGGSGGDGVLIYQNTTATITYTLSGGTGGTGGTGGSGADGGASGSSGSAGKSGKSGTAFVIDL